MDDPRYVVFALLDEPRGTTGTHGYATGGWVAAPIVGGTIARAAPLLGVAPVDETAPRMRRKMYVRINSRNPRVASY
jgi:cell division protein FtsI (penicillin-binding protein 3)